jgi:hypothetical protein
MKGEGEGWSSSDSDETIAEVQLTTLNEESDFDDVFKHENTPPGEPTQSQQSGLVRLPHTEMIPTRLSIPPRIQIQSNNQLPPTKENLTSSNLSSEPIYLLPNARISNYPLSAFTRPHMHPGWQCLPGGYTLEWDRRGALRPLSVDELIAAIDEAYEGTKDWEEAVRNDEAGWVKSEMGDWMSRER